MQAVSIIRLILSGVFAYMSIGSAVTVATAYVHHRITGRRWFTPKTQYEDARHDRWWGDQEARSLPPPGFVFVLWPILLPVLGVTWVVRGFFRATEAIGDRLLTTADEQRKRIGNFRSNPS